MNRERRGEEAAERGRLKNTARESAREQRLVWLMYSMHGEYIQLMIIVNEMRKTPANTMNVSKMEMDLLLSLNMQ